jgi:phosphatidate cytidylyltransferase
LLFGLPAILWGGWFFFLVVAFFLTAAAWEYAQMFRSMGYRVSPWLVSGAAFWLYTLRSFSEESAASWLSFLTLAFLAYHLMRYERGDPQSAFDYAISIAGVIYLGWIGAYLYLLRALPLGGWWIMLVLPIVWLADSGAYKIGTRFGKHRLSLRLSPGKTWEGFVAGLFTAILAGAFLAWAYSTFGPLQLTLWQGAALGLMLGLLTPLGDLGESLFKRQAGVKDSGQLFPGHGGAFDRIDSWLWAGVIGYFCIRYFFL